MSGSSKPLDQYESRLVCNACEVNWWPCLTYKVAMGEITDWEVPSADEPFGHPV